MNTNFTGKYTCNIKVVSIRKRISTKVPRRENKEGCEFPPSLPITTAITVFKENLSCIFRHY